MGNYLQDPVKEKETEDFENEYIRAGSSLMQGWRRTMEDCLVMGKDVKPGVSAFAVFDGHGGREIAKFCSVHFVEFLKKSEAFEKGNYEEALVETYEMLDDAIYNGAYDSEIESFYMKPMG